MSNKRRILVCGGGNGAHCLTALAALRDNIEVNVLSLFKDEAEKWSEYIKDKGFTLTISEKDGSTNDLNAMPSLITKDTEKAISGVQIIFLVVPAFAHSSYLSALAPYIQPNTLIVGLPGQAGFEFQCRNILGEKAGSCTIASFESLPWACRIVEFGKRAQILGFKESLGLSYIVGKKCKLPFSIEEALGEILGEKPRIETINNYIAINLMAKSMVHPPMMYGKWGQWDGTPLKEEPLFYQGIDERQADLLSKVSDEIIDTGKKLEKLEKVTEGEGRKGVDMSDVIHIFDWYKKYYRDQITDMSSLMVAMRTNKAYDGLIHPMVKQNDGFVPNFSYRYTTEDIPFGLVVMKGIAEIAGVNTPVMDEIIKWGQDKLGKEYIVGSTLTGRDIGEARAPQSFGINTVDKLFEM